MPFRLGHPLATYPRVKNLFERAPFGRVRKYYRSKFGSIQVPVWRKDLPAELTEDFLFHLWKFSQGVRCPIGIEEFRRRYDLSQATTKRAFARGNSARDPNRRHKGRPHRGVMPSARSTWKVCFTFVVPKVNSAV